MAKQLWIKFNMLKLPNLSTSSVNFTNWFNTKGKNNFIYIAQNHNHISLGGNPDTDRRPLYLDPQNVPVFPIKKQNKTNPCIRGETFNEPQQEPSGGIRLFGWTDG